MTKDKILKIISGLCVGIGVGACFGVAMHNIVVGLLFGLSLGICFAVTFVCVGKKKIVAFLAPHYLWVKETETKN